MSIESEARAEAEKRYPAHLPYNKAFEGAMRDREAFEQGYVAGASRPVSDEQILAGLNAEMPEAATTDLDDWGQATVDRMRRVLTSAREAGA